jgi:Skp family chaperone for outer membrane proteins
MKSILFIATIVLSLPVAATAQVLKIGYINSQDILAEAPGTQEAKDQFDADIVTYRTEVEGLAAELESLVQQYEQQQALLSPAARQTRGQACASKNSCSQ